MKLPPIGFGCSPFRGATKVDLEPAVRYAIRCGYRLFDAAELYGNELAIGRALRDAPRKELCIVGKLWRTNYRPEHVRAACEASLRRLQLDAFDLYLLHAPGALTHVAPLDDASLLGWDELQRRAITTPDDVPVSETWAAMRELVQAGLVRNIGVSNFGVQELVTLNADDIAANQIASPVDEAVVQWCHEHDVAVIAYSPLASASLTAASPRDILQSLIARGITPLVSSTNAAHIRENLEGSPSDWRLHAP
ncbi:MAG: aldo/keto reductase [Acidobacteriota bacterium]|nr:aldo/keto reductase [Acidobacteriota bacterium]